MEAIEIIRERARFVENAIINVLNNRPRYLRRIPKKFYVSHFLEIREPQSRPLIKRDELGSYKVTMAFRIYDSLRKKYVK